jgi:hypothetical protein
MPSSEETTWHGRLKTPQLNSLYTVTKSRTVITVVVTAWPREVSIAGGNGDRRNQVSGMGKNWSREEENEPGVRRGVFIGSRDEPRHELAPREVDSEREEEEHGVVLAGMRDERMRTSSSC